jgi:coenzyme F420-dependent glucose-6-phosphate dehydrogenase
MTVIGYHASHEQFSPADLLDCVILAEQAGFAAAMCSDHLFPWTGSHRDGVGFAYSWLGAALQATSLPFGVVSAPGQRYHPAILAQAATTLEQMFPGRFWLAAGSGENVNEHVTGDPWPPKPLRQQRLLESAEVMRALWRGETVNHDGAVRVHNARVYTTAAAPPPLFAAAVSPETAHWAGSWADGMITVNGSRFAEVVAAFRAGGGEGKPVHLQYHLSWAPDPDQALSQLHEQWRWSGVPNPQLWDLEMPEDFEAASARVSPADLTAEVPCGADLGWHAGQIALALAGGFDQVLLHNVGPNQREFIEVFGEKVLPQLT